MAKDLTLNFLGSHMGACSNPGAPLPIQLPVCGLESSQGWPKASGPWPAWENSWKFLSPSFRSVQLRPLPSLGEWIIRHNIFLPVSNKYKYLIIITYIHMSTLILVWQLNWIILPLQAPRSYLCAALTSGRSISQLAPCLWPWRTRRRAQSLGTLHPHGRPAQSF